MSDQAPGTTQLLIGPDHTLNPVLVWRIADGWVPVVDHKVAWFEQY